MKQGKRAAILLFGLVMVFALSACGGAGAGSASGESGVIDYLVLVNKENPLPEGWEEALDIVEMQDSQGWDVQVEKTAYEAYLDLKADLEKDGVYIDLDSAFRSVDEQQRIWDDFTEKYGEAYVKKYVAVPGYSEHHTGLALDLYLNIDGKDVYENEDMVEYPEVWAKIHAKLADHGFILRYPEGKEDITGYGYEPWHIRYVGPDAAKEIEEQGLCLEEYLGKIPKTAAKIDYGTSEIYTEEDMEPAILMIKKEIAGWSGCAVHSVRYAGDACVTEENLAWLNSLEEDKEYTQCIEFLSDFHSPTDEEDLEETAWELDAEYEDYQFWLAREDGGDWELVTWGY